jgi:hypothetical protein
MISMAYDGVRNRSFRSAKTIREINGGAKGSGVACGAEMVPQAVEIA